MLIGLEALHDSQVIYKDIKASHVFMNPQGQLTLIDFGLAEQVSNDYTYVSGGTLHSMSPEMLDLYYL